MNSIFPVYLNTQGNEYSELGGEKKKKGGSNEKWEGKGFSGTDKLFHSLALATRFNFFYAFWKLGLEQ